MIARDHATLLEGMRLADEEGACTDEELRLGVAAQELTSATRKCQA